MSENKKEELKLYDHVSNSGIVHLPGRSFPAVAIQGDSLSSLLTAAKYFMGKAIEYKDEDMYYEALKMAERLKGHLVQYESVLEKEGFEKPYVYDVKGLVLDEKFRSS